MLTPPLVVEVTASPVGAGRLFSVAAGLSVPVKLMLVKVASLSWALLTELVTRPTYTVEPTPMATGEPSCVKPPPGVAVYAVKIEPLRTIRSDLGVNGVPTPGVVAPVLPPVLVRHDHCTPLSGVITRYASRALSASDSRIITPALAQSAVSSMLVTVAVIEPLPESV